MDTNNISHEKLLSELHQLQQKNHHLVSLNYKLNKLVDSLQKKQEEVNDFLDNARDLIQSIDPDGHILYANNAWKNTLGYTDEDIPHLTLSNIIHPNSIAHCLEIFDRVISGASMSNIEAEFMTKDGKSIFVEGNASCCFKDGKPHKTIGIFRDISEQKRAEKKYRESETKYKELIDLLPQTVFEINKDGNVLLSNQHGFDSTGYTQQDIEHGLNAQQLFVPEERERVTESIQTILQGNEISSHEFTLLKKDGGRIPVLIYTNPIFEDDVPVGIRGIVVDIRERKTAEEALKKSQQRFKILAENVPGTIYLCKNDTRYTMLFLNDVVEDLTGYVKEDFLSDRVSFVELYHQEDAENIISQVNTAIEKRTSFHLTYRIRHKNNQWRWVEEYGVGVFDGDELLFLEGFLIDITERKRLEEQLQIHERLDSLGILAGGIAHDFNNLLVGIIGNIELLKMSDDNFEHDQKEYLEEAFLSSRRAAKLIKEIQLLSTGSVTEIKNIDIVNVVKDVFSFLSRTTDRLIEMKITVESQQFYVIGDYDQLYQVFLNLGINAIHAIEQKGVTNKDYIQVSAKTYETPNNDKTRLPTGEYIHVFFTDTGIGMPASTKRKAFDPLFTTKNRSSQKGQGLGLTMVYTIITRNHHGHIDIETCEGKGTTFHIYLPRAKTEEIIPAPESHEPAGGDETLLIVEDEHVVCTIAAEILKSFGYSVLTAFNGEDGLKLYQTNRDKIDAILLDLTMPKMSGKEFLELIVTMNPEIKVIIASGHSEEEMQKYTNAKGYISKPYSAQGLAHIVRSVLDM